jgi:hypothetical protein
MLTLKHDAFSQSVDVLNPWGQEMPNTPHGFRATTDWLMQNRMIPDFTHNAENLVWC